MKHTFRISFICIVLTVFTMMRLSGQTSPNWNTTGNAPASGSFLGTTNNEPLILKSNGIEAMRIKTNGNIQITAFQNMGRGLIYANNNGILNFAAFPNDTNQVFTGCGHFKSIAALSGWTRTGNVLYNAPGVNVGIGTSAPQYALEVVGSAYFHGTISAQGVILTNKLMADTMKAGSMFTLNNHMHMSAGAVNEIYTSTGELRFQSNPGNTYNTIFSAGTSGKVGIGVYNPAYKLDVAGDVRFSNKVYVHRLVSATGDSIVRFGDSTLYINYGNGTIYNYGPIQGVGIGHYTNSTGYSACAIGFKVHATQMASVAIGAGSATSQFMNTTPYSLAVTFNSNIPTFFVGSANGNGTVGKVGVGTSTPVAAFQVGQGYSKLCIGSTPGAASNYGTSYIGFNVGKQGTNSWLVENDFNSNGGAVIMGDLFGDIRFINIQSTGGTPQTLTDTDIQDNTSMRIRRDGTVIIGAQTITSGPHANSFTKLTVDGKVVCKELFVTNNDWADSIFDPAYTLMPMDSLRAYIDSAGHLPNVPTEKEIQENGSDLAQNDVMLLAKVEELTLYLLQLQEQNMKLQKRIEELEAPKEEGQK